MFACQSECRRSRRGRPRFSSLFRISISRHCRHTLHLRNRKSTIRGISRARVNALRRDERVARIRAQTRTLARTRERAEVGSATDELFWEERKMREILIRRRCSPIEFRCASTRACTHDAFRPAGRGVIDRVIKHLAILLNPCGGGGDEGPAIFITRFNLTAIASPGDR